MAHAMERGRDNKPFWRLAWARWRQSGLSVSAFCRAEGLREPSFYQKRRELEGASRRRPAFLPVHVVAGKPEPHSESAIEIVLAEGRCVRVGPGFDAATLIEVVDLLERGGH